MPKGVPNSADMYGIYSRPWGFEVSIVRAGVRYREGFGQASYGGASQALLHAQRWRDALVKSLPPPTRRSRAEKLRPNNKTGVPGVFRLLSAHGKMLGWLAKTYIAHDQILRALFLAGDQGSAARSMAIRERERQLAQMSGLAKVHPAEEAIRNAPSQPIEGLSPKRPPSEIVRKNNRSGISGVTFKAPRPRHPGYWMAITYIAGRGTVSKAFSVAAHGHDKARAMAVAERRHQLEQKRRERLAA